MAKSESPYKKGFVESELRRIASAPQSIPSTDLRHTVGMLAAGILILLERTARETEGGK